MNIDETLAVVSKAISTAEETMREQIKLYYHNVGEEFITTMLYSHINYSLREASDNKHIEDAFFEDLKSALVHQLIDEEFKKELKSNAEGLIADIVIHNKREEGKTTGGDFGLVIIHPEIKNNYDGSVEIIKGETSGLLCQAKLRNKNRTGVLWGYRLEKKQKENLPKYSGSLVLYSYKDNNGIRSELNPVAWKRCGGLTGTNLEDLLKQEAIDGTISTREIIERLGQKEIGTSNQPDIDEVIAPNTTHLFEIKIYWKTDKADDEKKTIRIENPQYVIEQELNRQMESE